MAFDGRDRVVIEVRTRITETDPIDAVDSAKRRRVRSLARSVGATRLDLIGIGIGSSWVDVHWVPDGP